MKRKLLLAALCVVGALGMRAQTDVTSTYLTNADFEGEYESYAKPSGDRDIYLPKGWGISYSNGEANDMTSLNSGTTQWSNFSGKPQPNNGEQNVYWIRCRWGNNETLTLTQETNTELPAGTYCLSVDAYSDDNTSTTTISVENKQQTIKTSGEWNNYKVAFTLASAQRVTVSLNYHNTGADNNVAAFDNVKLLLLTEPKNLMLRNELGGTKVDLQNFTVGDGDYTLEVEGTANTEITIAADNISYTPETTGVIRFVKADGIVYVYEGTSYKTAVYSSHATGSFPISGVSSASYVEGAYAPASSQAAYQTAKTEAENTLSDTNYAVITGEERQDLQAQLDAEVADYNTAANHILDALKAFTDAKEHYQALIDAQTAVPDLKYASAEKKAFLTAKATNAADADEKVAAMPKQIRALYESHAMAEGVKDAVDMTDKITNPKAESAVASPWTIVKGGNSGGNIDVKSAEPWTDGSDNATHKYFDGGNWGANSWDVSLEQEITLAPGKYLLTVTARAASDVTFSLYAGENKAAIPAIGAEGGVFNRGWNDQSVEFDVEKTGTVKIGVQGVTSVIHNWMSFSNFRLVRLEEVEMATETEYKALNNAVLENEKKTLGFNQGEYAPYANVEALTALEEAKAINQEEENTKAYIEALTKAVATWTANETDVDAIYNGLFATVTPGANYPEGWVRTNAWGQMESNISGTYATAYYNQPGSMQYGNQGLYTMPLAANTWYKLTFAYRSHENGSNNGMTVSVQNGEGEGLSAATYEANPSTSEWKEVERIFQTGAAGNYVLTLANEKNTWLTNVSITKSTKSTATMSVKAGKWGTFAAPFEVTIPEGVKAYKVTGVENEQIVKEEVEETIPANTPVVLLNETEEDVEETLAGVGIPESETVTEGLLTGIYQEGADIPADSYVLQTQGEKQAFYHAKDGFAGKGVANRCYLTMPAGNAPLRAIFFGSEEGTTGIEATEAAEDENAALYNLAGQKVDAGYKGIVIKKGKAMLKK